MNDGSAFLKNLFTSKFGIFTTPQKCCFPFPLTSKATGIFSTIILDDEIQEISYELNTKSIRNSKESIMLEKIRIALNANKSTEENLIEEKLNENLESDLNSNV